MLTPMSTPMPTSSSRHPHRILTAAFAIGVAALILGCSRQAEPSATIRPASTPAAATPTETPTPAETPRATTAAASIERPAGAGAATPAVAVPGQNGQTHAGFPPPPPKTTPVPPTASGVARMRAPRLGLDHHIEDVGVVSGEMETPPDAQYAVGWYRPWDKPGVVGNAVFSAHETWNHMQGPFYGLHEARTGDEITIDLASGARIRYRVFSNIRYDVNKMPMSHILWPTGRAPGQQWITLITCGGRLVYDASGFGEYLDRDVVIAQRFD